MLAICFVAVFSYRGSFSPLLKPSLLNKSARGCTPSLRIVYDVHVCFVYRHEKQPAPSKGQAWRLNRSTCISGNLYVDPSCNRYRTKVVGPDEDVGTVRKWQRKEKPTGRLPRNFTLLALAAAAGPRADGQPHADSPAKKISWHW